MDKRRTDDKKNCCHWTQSAQGTDPLPPQPPTHTHTTQHNTTQHGLAVPLRLPSCLFLLPPSVGTDSTHASTARGDLRMDTYYIQLPYFCPETLLAKTKPADSFARCNGCGCATFPSTPPPRSCAGCLPWFGSASGRALRLFFVVRSSWHDDWAAPLLLLLAFTSAERRSAARGR
jgi:hypothetical protein